MKLKLSEEWLQRRIAPFLPFDVHQSGVEVQILSPFDLDFTAKGVRLKILLNLKYPFKWFGQVSAKAKMSLDLSNLADIELIQVDLHHLEWLEEPRFQLGKKWGFGIGSAAKTFIEEAKKKIAPTLESGIPPAFKNFTEENALYDEFLVQELQDQKLQVKTKVKSVFYQSKSSLRWLDLNLFPVLDINISDRDNTFIATPGPWKPGVGGGLIKFSLDLKADYINELIKPLIKDKSIKAGNRTVNIDDLQLGMGNEGFNIDVKFKQNEPPEIKGLLTPILDLQNQILSFDIKHLELENASWFWRGLLSLLKSNIENKIEESLKINIKEMVESRIPEIRAQLEASLAEQQLQLKIFNPAIMISEVLTSSQGLIVNGKIGGSLEIWSSHSLEDTTA